jgi:hypothetical protein
MKQVNKNFVLCSGAVKAQSETKIKSGLLGTMISTFRMAVQILDILWKLLFKLLHSLYDIYETLQRMKGILIGRKIYINVRDGHAKN